ncbi:MAG: DUF2071 domain-containing protein [Chloroflexota bacterium]|nr:DUF2071 domain-containing protein [Chloroflexota bacterium]
MPLYGWQVWRRLLFVHWPVPPAVLRPLVPSGLSLDLFEGQAYLGLVLFSVEDARPLAALPLTLRFLETNVRTYVTLPGGDAPGVYFLSLDAGSLLAVLGARVFLGLPYFWATGQETTEYSLWRRTGSHAGVRARYHVGEPLGAARPETLDHFLIERYLLHTRRGPSLWSVRVHHQPYPLRRAELVQLEQALSTAAGVPALPEPPLVHYATGVDVRIDPPRIRLRG